MATWQAIVGSTTYSLSDGNPFKIISISGIGNAPVRRLEERGPFQDGSTDIGYRLDPRLINIVLYINASTRALADTYRDTLSGIFNPANGAVIKLRCTRDDGAVRQIDCYAVNLVDMPAEIPDRVLGYQRVGVQLKAPNPIWYNPSGTNLALAATPPDWATGGGLIGTTSVIWSGTVPGTAEIHAIPSGQQALTVFTRTARPTSGTSVLWSISAPATGTVTDYYLAATGSVGYTLDGVPGTSYTSSGTTYAAGTASLFFTRRVNGPFVLELDADYGAGEIRLAQHTDPYSPPYYGGTSYPGTVFRWRSASNSGTTWANAVTHAAIYKVDLEPWQRAAIVATIANTSGAYSGTVTNGGNWDEYPVITLTGPINDPVLTNHVTGDVLDFTGSTISANKSYVIDTRYGHKTILDSEGTNQIAKLADGSDLATFRLAPGSNLVQVTYTGGTTTATQVGLVYYDRYIAL